MEKVHRRIIKCFLIFAVALSSFVAGFARSSARDYPVHLSLAQSTAVIPEASPSLTPHVKTDEEKMDEESLCLGRIIQCIDQNSDDDKRTYGMCAVLRSLKYNMPIESIVNRPEQWVGYDSSMNITVTQKNYDIAAELIQIMHSGVIPIGTEFEYAEWSPSKVILKNDFENPTKTWWWGKVM